MKIGQKLILGFLGIALLVGVVGYVGFNSNKRIDENTHIIDMAHRAYEEIAKLEAIVLDQVHEGLHLLSFEEESCIEAFKKLGEDFRKQLKETKIAAAAAAAAAAPELREKFVAIEASHEKFEKLFDSVVKAHYAGQLATREQRHDMHGVWCPISDETIELTRGLQPLYAEMVKEAYKKSEHVVVSITRNLILVNIVAVFLAIILGLLIARSITKPITKLKDAATEIGKGRLDTRVVIKSKDEIGFLATSFNKMAEDLSVSMQKEKELAAAAAAAAESEKKRAAELEKAYEGLKQSQEKEKELAAAEKKRTEEIKKSYKELEDFRDATVYMLGDLDKTTKDLEKSQDASLNIMEDLERRRKELDDAIKELRETQAKLIQAGKMTAMGTLGAGIAHQLNQPLGGIRGFTQAVLMQIDEKSPFYEDLKQIEEQSGYMRDIIENIRGFARQAELRKEPIDINEPIEKALQLLSEQLRLHGVKLTKNFASNLPEVNADANQMQQVFANFIINAREAMDDLPKEAKKELLISTKLVNNNQKSKGEAVEIIFQDTGPGIPDEIKDKIFDAFFTTKGPQSTGLGLALNYGIIQDHGGVIEIESKEGKGTTFVVRLPAV